VLPGNTLKIVDPATFAVMPLETEGEIAVKGPTLMLGYLGTPLDETLDAAGFLLTGDRGRLDRAGRLFWEGRLSEVIKTGGANVSPREIDAVLSETLGEMVVTCVVPRPDEAVEEERVRTFARERLASYKVPRHVLVLREEELARTGSDKLKTGELRRICTERLAASQAPDPTR